MEPRPLVVIWLQKHYSFRLFCSETYLRHQF